MIIDARMYRKSRFVLRKQAYSDKTHMVIQRTAEGEMLWTRTLHTVRSLVTS